MTRLRVVPLTLFAYLATVNGAATEWPNKCGGCVFEVTDTFVLQRAGSSSATCDCGTFDLKYMEASMDSALAYTSIADGTFNGVSCAQLRMESAPMFGAPYRSDAGITGEITAAMFAGLTLKGNGSWQKGELHLEGHSITSVGAGVFAGCTMYKGWIMLNKNKINTIHVNAFAVGPSNGQSFGKLDLTENEITNLDFKVYDDLFLVEVDKNLLGPIASAPFGGTGSKMTHLNVEKNPTMKTIAAGALLHLTSLTNLDLGYCGLEEVPDLSALVALEKLDLAGGSISEVTRAMFAANTAIEELKLNENKIKSLPAAFLMGFPMLEDFSVAKNLLTEVPADLISTTAKGGPTWLTNLDLSYNRISKLPKDLLEGVTSIDYLSINDNRLRTLPPGFVKASGDYYGEYWYLENNFFEGPGLAEALGDFDELEYLYLEGNPLKCKPDFDDGIYVDGAPPGYDDLPTTCPAKPADKCSEVCDGNHKPLDAQTPGSCAGEFCAPNDANCCEKLPQCECKANWFHSDCEGRSFDGKKKRKGCPSAACGGGEPWCVVKNFPCAGAFPPKKTTEVLKDDLTPWKYCGAAYQGVCTNPCCKEMAKSKGKMIRVNGEKKTKVKNIEKCYELCQNTADCDVWEYKIPTSQCKLRQGVSEKVDVGLNAGNLWKYQQPRMGGTLTFGQNKGNERPAYRDTKKTVVGEKSCKPTNWW